MQVLDLGGSGLLHFSQLSQLRLTGIGRRAHLVVSRQNVAVRMVNPANPQRSVALDALALVRSAQPGRNRTFAPRNGGKGLAAAWASMVTVSWLA